MSVSSIVRGKVSSRKAIIRNEPRESMILLVNRFSSSFTSVKPLPAAYSRTNARVGSFTSSTEFSELFVIIFASYCACQSLVQKNLRGTVLGPFPFCHIKLLLHRGRFSAVRED